MTTEELQDWHARHDGWMFGKTRTCTFDHWHNADGEPHLDAESEYVHPYPPTLDGAASAMPEGWQWTRTWRNTAAFSSKSVLVWSAWTTGKSCEVFDTKDEIHDRYLLAKLAKEAMNANPR